MKPLHLFILYFIVAICAVVIFIEEQAILSKYIHTDDSSLVYEGVVIGVDTSKIEVQISDGPKVFVYDLGPYSNSNFQYLQPVEIYLKDRYYHVSEIIQQ